MHMNDWHSTIWASQKQIIVNFCFTANLNRHNIAITAVYMHVDGCNSRRINNCYFHCLWSCLYLRCIFHAGVKGSPVIEYESSHAVQSMSTKWRTFSNDVIQKAEDIFHIIVKSAKLVGYVIRVQLWSNSTLSTPQLLLRNCAVKFKQWWKVAGCLSFQVTKKQAVILLTFHVGHLPSDFKHIYYDLVDRIQSKYEDAVGVGYTTDRAKDTLDEDRDEYKLNFDVWTTLHSEPSPIIIRILIVQWK